MKWLSALILGLLINSPELLSGEIRDLTFEIHSDKIKEMVETKGTLKEINELYCQVYWMKDKLAIKVVGKVGKDVQKIVSTNCKRTSHLVLPMSMKTYLSPFKKVDTQGGWKVYRDDTGVNPINEIMVKKSKNQTRIIEKRPTGTTKLKYSYKKFKGERVLKTVEMSSYEGIQNIKTLTTLSYKKTSGQALLDKAVINTTQNLVRKEVGDYTRKLVEVVEFKNHIVNDSQALKYFNKN